MNNKMIHPEERQKQIEQLERSINKWFRETDRKLYMAQNKTNPNVRYALKVIRTGKYLTSQFSMYTNRQELSEIVNDQSDEIYMLRSLKDIRYVRKNGNHLLNNPLGNHLIGHIYPPCCLQIVKINFVATELKK